METINSMKTRVKAELAEGTHVSPEVYEALTNACNGLTDKLVGNAIRMFILSDDNRMKKRHVTDAFFYMMIEPEDD